jgi:hypothetical protein
VISNGTNKSRVEDINYLISMGYMDILIENLSSTDPKIISICLESLKNIFKTGADCKNINEYKNIFR